MSDASTDFIAVQVPARYVTRVYELISRLEREDAEISDAENAPPAPALTKELVARMYRESKESHEQLMLYLALDIFRYPLSPALATPGACRLALQYLYLGIGHNGIIQIGQHEGLIRIRML